MDAFVDTNTGLITPGCYRNQNDHLGKWILNSLEDNSDMIHQIEGISGATETCGSYKLRTIRMAQAMLAKGLKVGDVVLICAVNHMDAAVPMVASQYIGTTPANVAVGMTKVEVEHILSFSKPNLIFSDKEMIPMFKNVLDMMGAKVDIVAFDQNYSDPNVQKFSDYQKPTGTEGQFRCVDFDPEKTTAFTMCSSGTTGLSKLVSINHKSFVVAWLVVMCLDPETQIMQMKDALYLNFSPLTWGSAIVNVIGSCLFGFKRLQVTKPFSVELAKEMIERYRPNITMLSIHPLCSLVKAPLKIDLSSLEYIYIGGDIVNPLIFQDMQNLCPKAKLTVAYGCSEAGLITASCGFYRGSVGKVYKWIKWKILSIENGKEVNCGETGELFVKTPGIFLGYHNNPKATEASFDEEGFYRTGDIARQDSDGYIYIIDRLKEMIKYRGHHVNRGPIEAVINGIKGVFLTAVVGIPSPSDGELPAALVQLTPGAKVTEQQIIDKIKESLTDKEQLRGGVVILEKLPQTITGKIDRKAIHKMKHNLFNKRNNN